ncbi:leucyl/phenylalanyl-tRNA--protein transferase [Bordetella pertussis]|nr:leucyl/phenylalanyl-tRNA--protein transferase [Bordetella pertussis]CFP67679.1 leucyl/phenylalanyl-tRNA--protein transferase [Bordetella pertussis]
MANRCSRAPPTPPRSPWRTWWLSCAATRWPGSIASSRPATWRAWARVRCRARFIEHIAHAVAQPRLPWRSGRLDSAGMLHPLPPANGVMM